MAPPANPPRKAMLDALRRYRQGESRGVVFRDLVGDSIRRQSAEAVTALDVGCGRGFDGSADLQRSLGETASRIIGVEPDEGAPTIEAFERVHRRRLEEAPVAAESIHVVYSTFVLEHVEDPERFWKKTYECLAPSGVCWGFTVDARHFFGLASRLLARLGLKNRYLDRLHGQRGIDRYENYPTYYRSNTPSRIRRQTSMFSSVELLSVHRSGQLDYYVPVSLRPLSRLLERLLIGLGLPGSILIVRLEK